MKKFLSILLILATLCLFLFACNSNTTDTGNDTSTGNSQISDTSTDTDSDLITDTDTNIDTDSDILTDADTNIDTDSDISTDTDTNTDTDSDQASDTSTPSTPDDSDIIITDSDTTSDSDEDIDSDTDTEIPQPQATNFTMLDYNGNEITLDSLKGKAIVLNFWASWCPPCRNEMPAFEQAYKLYGSDVQFVMVSHLAWGSDTVESAKAFYEQSGYTFPVYFDTKFEAYSAYELNSIPRTVFINADGTVSNYITGGISYAILEQEINKIK